MSQLTVELNPAQCDIYDSLDGLDYIYQIGGRYSGKTIGALQMALLIALKCPGYKWVIFRKVYASIKDSIYEDLKGVIEMIGLPGCKILKSPLGITLPNNSEFIFKGMDDLEKVKGLARCHGFIMEELNEFDEMDFETIDNGIRGTGYPHYGFMMHNPVPLIPGSQFWFQKMFGGSLERGKLEVSEVKGLGKVAKLKTSYLDNKYCPEKRRQRLEGYKDTNPALYKLWAQGDYAEMKGVILKNWDIVDRVPDNIDTLGFGLDFGFSEDPAACVKVWRRDQELWVQGVVYSTGLTNDELFNKLRLYIAEYDTVIADSAEPKSIEDLYRKGLRRIKGVKKKPNYKAEMANILNGYKIHLVNGDTDLQREFSTWAWDEDKTGKLLPKPKDGNDHYIDALIMLCHEKLRKSREMSGGSL